MNENKSIFDENSVLKHLRHYLPHQAPLKDFIHHNTLHAFQNNSFHEGVQQASEIFGYRVYLELHQFREQFEKQKINKDILLKIISDKKGKENTDFWFTKMCHHNYDTSIPGKLGHIRQYWRKSVSINLDKIVHPLLFRICGAYLDQGISIWKFPFHKDGFLSSIQQLETSSLRSLIKSKRAISLLLAPETTITGLLHILVGNERLFENYLFDQQFAHPGWSGMAAVLEHQPEGLLDYRKISLHDFIFFELILEIEYLDSILGIEWKPLAQQAEIEEVNFFDKQAYSELFDVLSMWQEAMEWSFYDPILKGLQKERTEISTKAPTLQAIFCIDDRECSLRRHVENVIEGSETFGSAGFFNAEFYFQPEHGNFYTKVCPAPLTPKYIIKESEARVRHKKDAIFGQRSHGIFGGWISAPTMGFLSAFKLAYNIFMPAESPVMVSSFKHMDKNGKLKIQAAEKPTTENGLQVGYSLSEMADRIEGLFRSIGLLDSFAPLVYIVGHGASSVNNTHYAGYDCGACSGRAGSVNARVVAAMANNKEVRKILEERGIHIPENTQFLGALHDTTKDEIEWYDLDILNPDNKSSHAAHSKSFRIALDLNAKERSRRFLLMDTKASAAEIHKKVKKRALSLFEPRPEWNHATNAMCIVGQRKNNKHLFLDRRSFLNSYDYSKDPTGKYLQNILRAVAPVCGGINLEYYFSRVDNARLGAGTKLPHNVIGLFGVANGMDGDLRTGLPRQMINIHEPLRLVVIVEHFPEIVQDAIHTNEATYEWFKNTWVHLVALHPETKKLYYFKNESFEEYKPLADFPKQMKNMDEIFESNSESLPVIEIINS
jgi:uncharacterized protein YbcC (UPF0753/DUF2309 family)